MGAQGMTPHAWGPSQVLETSSQWPLLSSSNLPTLALGFPVLRLGIPVLSPCTTSLSKFCLLGFSPAACFFWLRHFQSQFLIPLLLMLASVLPPAHEAISHKAGPLDPFPELLVLPHVCFSPSQDDSLPSTLSNQWHLISGFCLHFPAVLHPMPKHVQPQHLGAAIAGQVLPRACNLGIGMCLVKTEPLEDTAAKFLRSICWTWAKAKDLAKVGLFSHSWHQGRFFSMPNVMSVLQGMDILELTNWTVAKTFFWCGQNNIFSIILFLEVAELFSLKF